MIGEAGVRSRRKTLVQLEALRASAACEAVSSSWSFMATATIAPWGASPLLRPTLKQDARHGVRSRSGAGRPRHDVCVAQSRALRGQRAHRGQLRGAAP
jgi:hypothetical protein